MKKIILLAALAVSLTVQAAEIQYFSLMGENRALLATTSLTVTNGTVGYSYTNVTGGLVVAGQYGYTNLFTNSSIIYTNYGSYQGGVFQPVTGMALSTGEPNNGAAFSVTLYGKEAGSSNDVTIVLSRSVDGTNYATAGQNATATFVATANGTTKVTFTTNLASAFMTGTRAIKVNTIAPGAAAGGTNLVVEEIGISSAIR